MNEKFKRLTIKLEKILGIGTCEFLTENLEEEETMHDVANLIISAHISSMFSRLMEISSGNNKAQETTVKIINALTKFMSEMDFVRSVESLN